ncbi:MAG: NAD-dependent epimerase/dehydratase family protein [Legionellaceae bacterium]|nr:NAD-dependent epimerase/dehydratase family protein [Legionellaceae bacterium]
MINSVIEEDLKYITGANLPWEIFDNKTVVVSGANGFLPSYMVEVLLFLNKTKGYNIKVIGLVRDLERAQKRFAHYLEDKSLDLKLQDICDPISLNIKVEYIIHAASAATPKYFTSNPVETILPNVKGTVNLLDLAVKNKVEGFLFFSTTGVYGFVEPDRYPLKEDCFGQLNPMSLASVYVESKRMGENMCVAWMEQYKVPIKVIRPAITYGPGVQLNDGRSFADFISNILHNQDIELFSDGKAIRNFCYIADAILGFFFVMLRGEIGEAYNIATNHEISIVDLANFLVEKVFPERKLNVVMNHDNKEKNFLRMNFLRTTVDISKAKGLGWELNFPLEDGFKRTIRSFEQAVQ